LLNLISNLKNLKVFNKYITQCFPGIKKLIIGRLEPLVENKENNSGGVSNKLNSSTNYFGGVNKDAYINKANNFNYTNNSNLDYPGTVKFGSKNKKIVDDDEMEAEEMSTNNYQLNNISNNIIKSSNPKINPIVNNKNTNNKRNGALNSTHVNHLHLQFVFYQLFVLFLTLY
jgi:hypothetical protein